jgi:hypothetical protein
LRSAVSVSASYEDTLIEVNSCMGVHVTPALRRVPDPTPAGVASVAARR